MMKAGIKRSPWQKIRKFFNDVHLWLGLGSGLIIVVVCFTGTAYVFNTEITEWSASHLYKVQNIPPATARIAPDDLIEKVKAISGGNVVSVKVHEDPKRTYTFVTKKEGDKSRFGTSYMVNPYTGEIVGNSNEKNSGKDFMSTMFSLHRWLLLDKVESPIISGLENRKLGSMITGWATIIFTLGCITGLIIWFPQKVKTWKQGLKIKMSGNWKRTNHDLHNTLAFYSLIFLLLMGITGPQWSFDWYRTGLQKTLGTYKPEAASRQGGGGEGGGGERGRKEVGEREKGGRDGAGNERRAKEGGERERKPREGSVGSGAKDRESKQVADGSKIMDSISQTVLDTPAPSTITQLLNAADKTLSYKGDYTISLPAKSGEPVMISKTKTGFFAPAAGDRISLDAQTLKVIKADIFKEKPFNERVAASIKALHVGNVYGTFSKILYFIACLIATSLPITGTLIWLNKLKKKRKRKTPGIATSEIIEEA